MLSPIPVCDCRACRAVGPFSTSPCIAVLLGTRAANWFAMLLSCLPTYRVWIFPTVASLLVVYWQWWRWWRWVVACSLSSCGSYTNTVWPVILPAVLWQFAVSVIPPVLHTVVVTSNRMARWQERTMGKVGGGGSWMSWGKFGGEGVDPCAFFWWFIRGSCNWGTTLGSNTVSRRLCKILVRIYKASP